MEHFQERFVVTVQFKTVGSQSCERDSIQAFRIECRLQKCVAEHENVLTADEKVLLHILDGNPR